MTRSLVSQFLSPVEFVSIPLAFPANLVKDMRRSVILEGEDASFSSVILLDVESSLSRVALPLIRVLPLWAIRLC